MYTQTIHKNKQIEINIKKYNIHNPYKKNINVQKIQISVHVKTLSQTQEINMLHIATQTEGKANIHNLYYTYKNIYIHILYVYRKYM